MTHKNTYCSNSKCELRHECLRQIMYEHGNMQGKWIKRFNCENREYFVKKEKSNDTTLNLQYSEFTM
jgi:hypothetical protein